MTRENQRKKVSPGLKGSSIVNIEEAFKELNNNSGLNKDNILAMIKKFIFQDMNSQHFQDVNYQNLEDFIFGTEVFVPGCTLLHMAARFNCPRLAKLLIERGANVNSEDEHGRTPLHYAAMQGNIEAAKVLIENGANNRHDCYGNTPLHYALENNYLEIARFLIANGASVTVGKILLELNDHQGLNHETVIGMMRRCIPYLVSNSSDVNYSRHKMMYYGSFKPILIHCTLLHIAAEYNCPRLADCLIKAGADVNSKDARDRTPLQVAFENDDLETATLLIANGADRACVPAYITKTSKLKGEATAVMMVIIATAITPIVLVESTELSASIITGATIASMILAGVIAYGIAYMWAKYELSSTLKEVKCDNSHSPQPTK